MKRLGSLAVLAAAALGCASAATRSAPGGDGTTAMAPTPILFVSRNVPPRATAGAIPGLGPSYRAIKTGGRLMVFDGRDPSDLLFSGLTQGKQAGPGGFFDVADPTVSPNGKQVAFAATPGDAGWRIHVLRAGDEGTELGGELVPRAEVAHHYDDLDPCWVDENTLVFASTRDGQRSEYDGSPVTQLFRLDLATRTVTRLTAERNGAEEPSLDRRTGRIVYSRWWFNRTQPPGAASTDTVNVWQVLSMRADGTDARLVAPRALEPRRESLYQPVMARDGSLYGVLGDVAGLAPSAGNAEVVRVRPNSDRPQHVAGAFVDPKIGSNYGSTRGLASPSACAPWPAEDGRVIVSLDPGGRGDYGLWSVKPDGSDAQSLIDLPGTLELDAVEWKPWRAIPAPPVRASLAPLPGTLDELLRTKDTFRFTNRNVFGAGYGAKEAAAARAAGPVRIRFWASLPRTESSSGDTVVLVRETVVAKNGSVDERGLPAGVPMFEQLIDAKGNVLQSAHGPAHVAGFNMGTPGGTSTCIGCHRGHSRAK